MGAIPPAIIFVNNDLTAQVQGVLEEQLMITESMDGYEFDQRVAADPNYPDEVHLNNLRILVIRNFHDQTNRNLADVVGFIKDGLFSIESNKVGPPNQTFPVDRLQIEKILVCYPIKVSDHHRDNVQSNIIYPLHPCDHKIKLYPLGTDCIREKKKDE